MDREFIAQLIIILGLSLGGWAMFVHPKATRLTQLQSVFRTVPAGTTPAGDGAIEHLADMLGDGQRRISTITYRNKLAENVTLLYGMISDLGARTNVTVQSLTPVPRPGTNSEKGFRATRIDMVLEGGYESIAAFVETVQGLPGFIRSVGLTIKPAGEVRDGLVTANFSCEIMKFDVPEALNELGARP
jgi:hypothetical protein